jgi:hypothetical protein
LSFLCLGAFGQGKISFQNDSLHLVYYGVVFAADAAFLEQGVALGAMPSGVTLVADLYVGTSSSVLSFVSSAPFSVVPGKWQSLSVQVPGIPGGTSVFVITQVRDQAFAPSPVFDGNFAEGTWAYSQEFTFTLGSSVTYPVMWGANGTWPVGTFDMGSGNRGAIGIAIIPEPVTLGFAVLASLSP